MPNKAAVDSRSCGPNDAICANGCTSICPKSAIPHSKRLGMREGRLPGKILAEFITANFGIPDREQKLILEKISDTVADAAPAVREMMNCLAGFKDKGKRMLATWNEGVNHLRDSRMYGLTQWKSSEAFEESPTHRSWRTHER